MANGERGGDGLLLSTLETLLREASDMIYVKDDQFRYVGASKGFCNLFGRAEAGEVAGKTDFELFPRPIAETALSEDRTVLEGGRPLTTITNRMPAADGASHCLSVTRAPVVSAEGRVVGLYGVVRDVTHEYDAQQAYDAAIERYFRIANDVCAAILIDVDDWAVADVRVSPIGRGVVSDVGGVYGFQRHLIDSIATDDEARAFISSLSPGFVRELYLHQKSEITCEYEHAMPDGARRWMSHEFHILENPAKKHLMLIVVVRDIHGKKACAYPRSVATGEQRAPAPFSFCLDLPMKRPIRMGGTFVACVAENLTIVHASEGFIELLGGQPGENWLHPEDAATLLKRYREAEGPFTFFARLMAACGDTIHARLECGISADGTELYGAAFNASDKIAAEQIMERMRAADKIIEHLASAELECVSLIDAETADLVIVNCAGPGIAVSAGDRMNYISEYEPYLRARVVSSEVEDCLRKMAFPAIKAALSRGDRYELSYSMHENAEIRRKKWLFSYLNDERDTIIHMRSDISDAYMMEFDPISGLYNRYKFQREARRLLDRYPERRFVLIRFDMDNFRVFNDLYGVHAGNRLIASVKDLLRTFSTPLTLFGHIEADHFACIMPENELNLAPDVDKILEWLRERTPDFDFSLKIGIYLIDDPALDIATMSNRALLALNSIKGKFGEHIAFYSEAMRDRMLYEQSIVNDMCQALENGEFKAHIQPQYNHMTGEMVGAEMLLRWDHPRKGLLAPSEFVPIFESNGFITQLDKHVWGIACQSQRRWLDMGLPVVPLSVNVSRADIHDPEMCATLRRLVDKYRLDPHLIHLEITETVYMKNPEQLIDTVRKLRTMGFIVEMDDFGSGYSSLNMLKDVEVDVLKLDMAFLKEEGTGARGDSILRSVIRMAHLLKIPVIAEGVETVEQANYLTRIGCKYMQGYYFARPMPPEEYEARLAAASRTGRKL